MEESKNSKKRRDASRPDSDLGTRLGYDTFQMHLARLNEQLPTMFSRNITGSRYLY